MRTFEKDIDKIRKKYNKDDWITMNGSHVEVGEDGELKGTVGEAIRGRKSSIEDEKASSKEKMNKAAMKEAEEIGTSIQKIGGNVHVSMNTASWGMSSYDPISKTSKGERVWAKVTNAPSSGYKSVGSYGNFSVYSDGTGDRYGYECVLNK